MFLELAKYWLGSAAQLNRSHFINDQLEKENLNMLSYIYFLVSLKSPISILVDMFWVWRIFKTYSYIYQIYIVMYWTSLLCDFESPVSLKINITQHVNCNCDLLLSAVFWKMLFTGGKIEENLVDTCHLACRMTLLCTLYNLWRRLYWNKSLSQLSPSDWKLCQKRKTWKWICWIKAVYYHYTMGFYLNYFL